MKILITALVLLLPAPAMSGEIFLGAGLAVSNTPTHDPLGRDPLFLVRAGYQERINKYWTFSIEAQHQCSLLDGNPINDRPDHRQQNSLGVFVYRSFRLTK